MGSLFLVLVINALIEMFGMIQLGTPYANPMDRKGELVERFGLSLQGFTELYVDACYGMEQAMFCHTPTIMKAQEEPQAN
jgi:hypothetical protein